MAKENKMVFFRKKPEGKRWSGGLGSLDAGVTKAKAVELKMLPAFKRFAKALCEDHNIDGIEIRGISFIPRTDTCDDYIKI